MIASSARANVLLGVLLAMVPVLGALFGAALGRWADARNRRRDQYADAMRLLVRWAEYPFRIRRRTSNDRDELRSLIDLGHDLQEQLQCHRTWIEAESRWMGEQYNHAIALIKMRSRDAIADAWRATPITTGTDLVLNGWGPEPIDDVLRALNRGISFRFGLRRAVGWLPGVRETTAIRDSTS
jgi:hypothetical protein